MAEFFESITVEIRTGAGVWTDVTADVLASPAPSGQIGIMGDGFLDRVAEPGTFKFSLNNSESNANQTLGYYSDGGAGRSLLTSGGAPVRLGFTYSGATKYKWFGYIEPDGLTTTPGTLGARRVDVSCIDWMGYVARYPLDFLAYATNKRIDEAAALVVASLPSTRQPSNTEYYTGDYTFPDVFDVMKGETTATGEFNKLAISEFGYIYTKGNGDDGLTLVVENKLKRFDTSTDTSIPLADEDNTSHLQLVNGSDELLLVNGTDKLLLVDTQTVSFGDSDLLVSGGAKFAYGKHYANYLKASVTPRRVDAAATTILWTMEASIEVPAGQTVGPFRGRYRDPAGGASYVNGIEMVDPPVSGTDFQAFENADGTGTDRTAACEVTAEFGSAEVEYTIRNTGASNFFTGGDIVFQVRGKGDYLYDSTDVILDFTNPGIGRVTVMFDMIYQSDPIEARRVLAASIYKDATETWTSCDAYPLLANKDGKNMMAFMYLEPGSRATFAETMNDFDEPCFINGYKFKIIGKEKVFWTPVLVRYDKVPIN